MKKKILTIFSGVIAALTFGLVQISNVSALVDTPWGPDRTTFTWADPAPYATFNSITDNPSIGDERNFVRIREVKDGEKFGDEVTLEMGKTYEVYIYYHNNADAHDVGKTAIGIADGASVKSSFPATVKAGEKATVTGTIFASDTEPLSVWDGAYMTADQDVYLRYVPGTATIHNGGALDGSSIGPDYLFGDGALLGYNKFSGILPGCNEYAGYITYQIFVDAPDFTVKKSIVDGADVVKTGDEITFKIRYENIGTMNQSDVVVKDELPDELEYVAGSTMLYNNNFTDGKSVNDDIVSVNGMNIGDYAGGSGWAEITYKAKVKSGSECGAKLENGVTVSTNDGNKHDATFVTVKDDTCEEEPDEPVNPDEPDEPEKEDCVTNPEMEGCQELPDTGPVEIALACAIVIGIGGGGYYFYRTRRSLKMVEQSAKGEMQAGDLPKEERVTSAEEKSDPGASQKPDDMVK